MKLKLNDNGYVQHYCILGDFSDGFDCEVDDPENIEEWDRTYEAFYFDTDTNKLVFDEEFYTTVILSKQQDAVWRDQRKRECFPIINRGQLWYNTLTDEQKDDLSSWYRAWLDITKTRVEPEMPEWLDALIE